MNRNRKKLSKRVASAVLTGSMVLTSMASVSFAEELQEGQANEYTQANLENAENGTGLGTVYESGTFDVNTDYDDESFYTEVDSEDTTFPDSYPKDNMEPMDDETLTKTIDALMKTMTFEEKINLVSMNTDPENRSGVGYITGVPRLGVPESRMHDGPSGISTATQDSDSYVETTNMPLQLTTSMTWSTELAYAYGEALGKEHVSTGSGWQLGMQMDVARTSHWARAKDTFGEDYYLTSRLAVAETQGLQENGGIAMAKHIGAYATDGDTSLWVEVDEQTLHTAYLYPFESAAKEARVASIMGTYNRLNGYYTSSNSYLQIDVLRDMWNWQGAMVPDWGANQEFSMSLGTTISQSNAESVESSFRSAASQGILTIEDLNEAARTTLYAYGVSGYLNLVEIDENGYAKEEPGRTEPIKFERTYEEDREAGLYEENNEVAKEIAEKGTVLLKNEDDTLPLTSEDYTGDQSVALIGYGAVNLIGGTGGERSFGVLEYMTTPYESMKEIAGEDANITTAVLNNIHGTEIPAEMVYQSEEGTENGWVRTNGIKSEDVVEEQTMMGPGEEEATAADATPAEPIENPGTETGSLVAVEETVYLTTGQRDFKNSETGTAMTEEEAYTWTGYVEAPESGDYSFVIQTNGGTANVQITVDGENAAATVSDGVSWDYYTTEGLNYSTVEASLEAGKRYKVVVTAQHTSSYRDQGVKLTWILPSQEETDLANALAAAKENDTVVMFTRTGTTGHGPTFQTDFDISLDEIEQIKAVQQAAKENGNKFVLVVFGRSGFSFEGDWLEDTDALLVPFYAGQSAGTAIAEILTGVVNPSAKLTMTLPKTSADTLLTYGYYDNPDSETNYNVERVGDQSQSEYTAKYTEGLNFGYRWYDAEDVEPQYAFGYGLSYTDFEYSDYSVTVNDDHTIDVNVTVTNTGDVTGDEIVQVYVGAAEVPEGVQMVEKQLAAFARVEEIEPGESKTVTMQISERMLSYWDSSLELIEREDGTKDKWVLATGERDIMVGSSSDNLTYTETVNITE